MRPCAFLTMDSLENFQCYDHLLYIPFENLGWEVTPVSWRDREVIWDDYEAVIIRSPWDYQDDFEAFLGVLDNIERSSARLENPLELVKWNISKSYLLDMEKKGIKIVPSIFGNSITREKIRSCFNSLNSIEIVIKPLISANADDTFRLLPDDPRLAVVEKVFHNRDYLVQPFMDTIVGEGEYSLFFFGGNYSHTILKTPKINDFRVQEEHGGTLQSIEPEPLLLETAKTTMATLTPRPLYGRADFVRDDEGYYLMELELIEPSLYFNMDPESPNRFANAFSEWMDKGPTSTAN